MRADVLEVMAEEISGRPVDPLASFVSWDDGRRRLDGMARGRRWDIDREQRAWEKDNGRDIRRLEKLRARQKNRSLYRATDARYRSRHKEKLRVARQRRYWKNRASKVAQLKASRQKHRAKRNAEALAYYYAHRDQCRANQRAWYAKNRALVLAKAKLRNKGQRREVG